jgi:dTMP kinase
MNWVIEANSLSAELLRPNLTIFIDISPETGMKRLNKGRDVIELFETHDELQEVREKYFKAFELLKSQENIFITDGNREAESIAADIWKRVAELEMLSNSEKV